MAEDGKDQRCTPQGTEDIAEKHESSHDGGVVSEAGNTDQERQEAEVGTVSQDG